MHRRETSIARSENTSSSSLKISKVGLALKGKTCVMEDRVNKKFSTESVVIALTKGRILREVLPLFVCPRALFGPSRRPLLALSAHPRPLVALHTHARHSTGLDAIRRTMSRTARVMRAVRVGRM